MLVWMDQEDDQHELLIELRSVGKDSIAQCMLVCIRDFI